MAEHADERDQFIEKIVAAITADRFLFGLGDRTPTERAALQRLSKLATRLTRSAADDPELSAIKRDILTCLDKVTTVAVSWHDIAALPAVERAQLLPQLTPMTARGA